MGYFTYIASCYQQSDDNLVKIWRTSDWSLERDIREPFVNAPGTTFFRRLRYARLTTNEPYLLHISVLIEVA